MESTPAWVTRGGRLSCKNSGKKLHNERPAMKAVSETGSLSLRRSLSAGGTGRRAGPHRGADARI